MTLQEIIQQLEWCGYECEAGRLENNVAWQELRKMAQLWSDARIEQWVARQTHFTDGRCHPPTWELVDTAMRMIRDDYEKALSKVSK